MGVPGSQLFARQWWLTFHAFVGFNRVQSGFSNLCPLAFFRKQLGVRPDSTCGV